MCSTLHCQHSTTHCGVQWWWGPFSYHRDQGLWKVHISIAFLTIFTLCKYADCIGSEWVGCSYSGTFFLSSALMTVGTLEKESGRSSLMRPSSCINNFQLFIVLLLNDAVEMHVGYFFICRRNGSSWGVLWIWKHASGSTLLSELRQFRWS